MSQFHAYKEFPPLSDLDPGIEPGWQFDVIALKAEPSDRVGSILMPDATKDQEAAASTRWLIVAMAPTAFLSQDWDRAKEQGRTDGARPFSPGDIALTRRYPPGQEFVGNDGRVYRILKDTDFIGKLIPGNNVEVKEAKAAA